MLPFFLWQFCYAKVKNCLHCKYWISGGNRLSILAESDLSCHFVSLLVSYWSFLWWLNYPVISSATTPHEKNNDCKYLCEIIMKTKPIQFGGAQCLWRMHLAVSLWNYMKAVCFLSGYRTWATFPSCCNGHCLVSIKKQSFVSWTHPYSFSFSWST